MGENYNEEEQIKEENEYKLQFLKMLFGIEEKPKNDKER